MKSYTKDNVDEILCGIFRDNLNIDFQTQEPLKKEKLLGQTIGLFARDLLFILQAVEKEFYVEIPESSIANGLFNSYVNIKDLVTVELERKRNN